MKAFNTTKNTTSRRITALAQFEKQLAAGTKNQKKTNKVVPLTDKDVKRITKMTEVLDYRIKNA